jgi:hypothetical protein
MNTFSRLLPLLFGLLLLGGCQIAGDIFKAGVWVGVVIVLLIIGGVIWAISKSA